MSKNEIIERVALMSSKQLSEEDMSPHDTWDEFANVMVNDLIDEGLSLPKINENLDVMDAMHLLELTLPYAVYAGLQTLIKSAMESDKAFIGEYTVINEEKDVLARITVNNEQYIENQ